MSEYRRVEGSWWIRWGAVLALVPLALAPGCSHPRPGTAEYASEQASSYEQRCTTPKNTPLALRFEACYRAGLVPINTHMAHYEYWSTIFDWRDSDLEASKSNGGRYSASGAVPWYDTPRFLEHQRPFIESACQLELMGAVARPAHSIDPCLVWLEHYDVPEDAAVRTLLGVCNLALAEVPFGDHAGGGGYASSRVPDSAAGAVEACAWSRQDVERSRSLEWGGYNRYTFTLPDRPERACVHPRLLQSTWVAPQELVRTLLAACDRGSSEACFQLMTRVPPQYQDYPRKQGYASALEVCGNCGAPSTCDALDRFIPNDPRTQEARALAQRTNDRVMAELDQEAKERQQRNRENLERYRQEAEQSRQDMLNGIAASGVYLQSQLNQQAQTYAQAQSIVADANRSRGGSTAVVAPGGAAAPTYQQGQALQPPAQQQLAQQQAAQQQAARRAAQDAARESCLRSFTPTTVAHTNPFPAYVQEFQAVVSAVDQCPAHEKLASCLSRLMLWPDLSRIRQELNDYFDACGYANLHKRINAPCGAGRLGIPNTERDTCIFLGRQGCLPNLAGALSSVTDAANSFASVYAAADEARNDELRGQHEARCRSQYPN